MKLAAAPLYPLLAFLLLVAAGCDRSPSDTGEHTLGEIRLTDADAGDAAVAIWTAGEGWNVQALELRLSSPERRLALRARAFTASGSERPLSGSYSLRWRLAPGAVTGVLVTDDSAGQRFLGDQVRIYGLAAGTTRVQFLLWHGTHEDGASDPIEIRVVP